MGVEWEEEVPEGFLDLKDTGRANTRHSNKRSRIWTVRKETRGRDRNTEIKTKVRVSQRAGKGSSRNTVHKMKVTSPHTLGPDLHRQHLFVRRDCGGPGASEGDLGKPLHMVMSHSLYWLSQ